MSHSTQAYLQFTISNRFITMHAIYTHFSHTYLHLVLVKRWKERGSSQRTGGHLLLWRLYNVAWIKLRVVHSNTSTHSVMSSTQVPLHPTKLVSVKFVQPLSFNGGHTLYSCMRTHSPFLRNEAPLFCFSSTTHSQMADGEGRMERTLSDPLSSLLSDHIKNPI